MASLSGKWQRSCAWLTALAKEWDWCLQPFSYGTKEAVSAQCLWNCRGWLLVNWPSRIRKGVLCRTALIGSIFYPFGSQRLIFLEVPDNGVSDEVNECPALLRQIIHYSSVHLTCEKEDQPFVQVQCHHLTFILADTGVHQKSMCNHVTPQSPLSWAWGKGQKYFKVLDCVSPNSRPWTK